MSQNGEKPDKKTALRSLNLTLAAVTGQVGCLTVIIIVRIIGLQILISYRLAVLPVFIVIVSHLNDYVMILIK